MPDMREPRITVNGRDLTEGQSMAVRVAIQVFLIDLQKMNPGDLQEGMHAAYRARLGEINHIIAEGEA